MFPFPKNVEGKYMKIRMRYIIFLIFLIIISAIAIYKDVIFQEGNPLPVINGMFRLNETNSYVLIDENPIVYLTKTNNKDELFEYIQKQYDIKLKEQLGSGYIFEGENIRLIMTSRQYTKFYQVWRLSLVGDKLQ